MRSLLDFIAYSRVCYKGKTDIKSYRQAFLREYIDLVGPETIYSQRFDITLPKEHSQEHGIPSGLNAQPTHCKTSTSITQRH